MRFLRRTLIFLAAAMFAGPAAGRENVSPPYQWDGAESAIAIPPFEIGDDETAIVDAALTAACKREAEKTFPTTKVLNSIVTESDAWGRLWRGDMTTPQDRIGRATCRPIRDNGVEKYIVHGKFLDPDEAPLPQGN